MKSSTIIQYLLNIVSSILSNAAYAPALWVPGIIKSIREKFPITERAWCIQLGRALMQLVDRISPFSTYAIQKLRQSLVRLCIEKFCSGNRIDVLLEINNNYRGILNGIILLLIIAMAMCYICDINHSQNKMTR